MKRSKVYFTKVGDNDHSFIMRRKLLNLVHKVTPFEFIEKDKFVAVKISFGEKGNTRHLDPEYVNVIAREAKEKSKRVFLTDTNTLYKGERTNAVDHIDLARKHKFQAIGVPIIIADGLLGHDGVDVPIEKGVHFKNVRVASTACHADYIIGVSHLTAHMVTGIGGAIKNIGMGFATRSGKHMQHSNLNPKVNSAQCTLCKKCMSICPVNAITVKGDKAKIDDGICIGCAECLVVCQFGAIAISWSETSKNLQEKMVEFAYGILKDKKKSLFFNFAIDIASECDCMPSDYPIIAPNIGIFMSNDIVAVEEATMDILCETVGEDVFKKAHPDVDWHLQLEYASKIGLGSLEYELICVE